MSWVYQVSFMYKGKIDKIRKRNKQEDKGNASLAASGNPYLGGSPECCNNMNMLSPYKDDTKKANMLVMHIYACTTLAFISVIFWSNICSPSSLVIHQLLRKKKLAFELLQAPLCSPAAPPC